MKVKRIISIIVILVLISTYAFSGCSNNDNNKSGNNNESDNVNNFENTNNNSENNLENEQNDIENEQNNQNQNKESNNNNLTEEEKEPITLYFWSGIPEDKGPMQAMEEYTKLNPHVSFEFTKLGWDDASNTKLDTALMSGMSIDVYTPTRAYIDKAAKGLALDLSEYLEKDSIDLVEDIGEDVLEMKYDDKYFSIPLTRGPVVWLLNLDKFEEKNVEVPDVDWTVGEMREIARKLTDENTYGAYLTHNWPVYWATTISSGYLPRPYIYDYKTKETKITDPLVLDTLEMVIEMSNEEKSIPSYMECISENYWPSSVFIAEKAAMICTSSYIIRDVKDLENYPHEFKTAVLPPPKLNKEDVGFNTQGFIDNLMIAPSTEKKDETWEFVKWLFYDGVVHLAAFGRFPSYNQYEESKIADTMVSGYEDIIEVDSFRAFIEDNSKRINTGDAKGVGAAEIMQVIMQETEKALIGDVEPKKALEAAQERVLPIIEEIE